MKREIRDLFYSVFPKNRYLESEWNNSPITICAPHGGGMRPLSIPRRKHGKRLMDTYTRRLTRSLVSKFKSKPNFSIADIHRSRVDLNRNYNECCESDKARDIWDDWNDTSEIFIRHAIKDFGKGLYVDIHSHNDSDEFQLGYNLNSRDYRELEKEGRVGATTTLDSLEHAPYEMIFGPYSIKQSLEFFGYKVYYPTGEDVYFNGGRDVEVFSGGGMGAIQIECPVSVLKTDRRNVANVLRFAIDLFAGRFIYDDYR